MATAATATALATKTTAQVLQRALRAAAFARIVMGLTLTLILFSLRCCLFFRRGHEGLVVFFIAAERCFRLDPCLEAGVKHDVILALAYGSDYLRTQSGLEEPAPVVVRDVSNLAGSDNIGTKQRNGLIRALLHRAKLLKGCISAVLSQAHPAIDEVLQSRPGIITLWVPYAVLVPWGSSVADEILFCKYHLVPFRRVNPHV